MGVNLLLSIGNSALLANQVALNVTGNNVANMDVDGYSRQSVRFQDSTPINMRPGQIGTGTYVQEVYRNFNRFLENAYLDKFTQTARWEEQASIMLTVQNIFNEANRDGINSQLSAFFNSWSEVSASSNSLPNREALWAQANNLSLLFRESQQSLSDIQHEMDVYIRQTVDDANSILDDLLKINKAIAAQDVPRVNNANSLYDERDRLIRSLSELVDIRVDDKGGTDFTVFTKSGQVLYMDQSVFKLELQNGVVEKKTRNFMGELEFSGSDSYEYTLEFVDNENFRVSLDSGKSWLRNEDGSFTTFKAPPAGETIRVKNLDISFDYSQGGSFTEGDNFYITPKTAVYWDSPTRDPINLTPQTFSDGTEDITRLTGGKLSSYFQVRDYHVGRYMDKLDALANSLVWEVNYLHSQGAGLKHLTNMQGSYEVPRPDLPLGSLNSGLDYSQRLTEGNLSMYFYDSDTGESIAPAAPMDGWKLDFNNPPSGDGTVQNFDPAAHSLHDVLDALNRNFVDPATGQNMITASIEGGKLFIQAADGYEFDMGADSSGLMAALGLNTFFQGSDANSISLNPLLKDNPEYINAQSVDGQGDANVGDGSIAALIAQLSTKEISISTMWENSHQSLVEYHASLVGLVGSETQNALFNQQFSRSLSDDLDARCQSISGVNLDEEMTNLIRFQHSYTAAAKLITTADQMLQTILGLKQ